MVSLMLGLIGTLTLLLALVAGLGVLNTVVLNTRDRVHDLGVFKAIGMTPRQIIAMVVCWVAGTGLVAGLIALPAGIALQRVVLPVMASSANLGLPASYLSVYRGPELVAAGPGRGGDRRRRGAAPGGLGGPDPYRLRPARRVAREPGPGRPDRGGPAGPGCPGRGGSRQQAGDPGARPAVSALGPWSRG